MAKRNNVYKDFPDRIFGLKGSQHRPRSIREILALYNKRFGAAPSKLVLLRRLVLLERKIPEGETAAIIEWLADQEGQRLSTLVERARGSGGQKQKIEQKSLDGGRSQNLVEQQSAHDTQKLEIEEEEDVFRELNGYHNRDKVEEGRGIALGPGIHPAQFPLPPPATKRIECSVCMESLAEDVFPKQICESCDHKPTLCISCLTQSIDSKIESEEWDQITCPECPIKLGYHDVQKLASKTSFQRYDDKSRISALNHDDTFIYCLGPGCPNGQLHFEGANQPIVTCNSCHFQTCFIHKMQWHGPLTCSEYDEQQKQRKEQEDASENLIAKTTKTCPNPDCGCNIAKISGCDHMTCKKCGHEFCWICMAPFREIVRGDNSAHAVGCVYRT